MKRFFRHFFFVGLAEERAYFVENLSLMIGASVSINIALDSIRAELRSARMKGLVNEIKDKVAAGRPLWVALDESSVIPKRVINLVKIGEYSGNLPDYLRVISASERRERGFRAKIKSAMIYPALVFTLSGVVALVVAWFILPKLADVFQALDVPLPFISRVLISLGLFIGAYGSFVVPLGVLILIAAFYFIFLFPGTRFLGQFILFHMPGLGALLRQVELARFGHLLGTLLERTIPVEDALASLVDASGSYQYRKFYTFLRHKIVEGYSIERSLRSYPYTNALVPRPIQSLIIAASNSGQLSRALITVGETFEEKTETTMKNVSVILEPILLVIVWLAVLAVALAVILPIYSIIGGISQ